MKNLNLNEYGVKELSISEVANVNGGMAQAVPVAQKILYWFLGVISSGIAGDIIYEPIKEYAIEKWKGLDFSGGGVGVGRIPAHNCNTWNQVSL